MGASRCDLQQCVRISRLRLKQNGLLSLMLYEIFPLDSSSQGCQKCMPLIINEDQA